MRASRRLWPCRWPLLVLPLPLLHTHSALALVLPLPCASGAIHADAAAARRKTLAALAGAGGGVRRVRGWPQMLPHGAGPKPGRSATCCGCTSTGSTATDDGTLKDNYFWFYIKNIGLVYLLHGSGCLSTPSPTSGGSYGGGAGNFGCWRSLLCSSPTITTITSCCYVWHMPWAVFWRRSCWSDLFAKRLRTPCPGGRWGWRRAVLRACSAAC